MGGQSRRTASIALCGVDVDAAHRFHRLDRFLQWERQLSHYEADFEKARRALTRLTLVSLVTPALAVQSARNFAGFSKNSDWEKYLSIF